MKTSAIILRVADFLKAFPPFCYLPEEGLLELARSGRVRFCEKGEILFEEGQERDKRIFIINKGAIRLVRGAGEAQVLIDKRGAGDFLGAGIMLGEKSYGMTALVEQDSIIYVLDATVFSRVCTGSEKAARFLAIFFATNETDGESGRAARAPQWRDGHLETLKTRMVSGSADCTVREAAKAMAAADSSIFVVLDAEGRATGVVTETDLRNEAATGRVPLDAPVEAIMRAPVHTVPADASPEDSLLGMIRHSVRHLCVTGDGTGNGRAMGVLTERDLTLSHGTNPMELVREIRRCRSPGMLRQLGEQLDLVLLDILHSPEEVPWCARLAAEARRAMVRRAEKWAREAMSPQPSALVLALAGSAGRGESLTQTDFPTIAIFADSDTTARQWITDLIERIDDILDGAGFHAPRFGRLGSDIARARPVEEWKEFFRELVRDPMGGEVWKQMTFFDLSALGGDTQMLDAVQAAIQGELAGHKTFIRLLANDALENLPPVTIFEGYAVEADGLLRETIDLKGHALTPISDIARVLHLEGGYEPAITNTLDRLEAAARRLPQHEAVLSSAARAFRIAQFFRARNGLQQGGTGDELRPSLLTRSEQVHLKTAFRAIADLIAMTSRHYGFQV